MDADSTADSLSAGREPSDLLIEFLRGWEGPPSFRVREDPAAPGVYDIGYGHVCRKDHQPVTPAWCDDTLRADAEKFADAVNEAVTVDLSQHEFDALVSFAFNVGVHAFKTSTLLRALNRLDFDGAADQFARWNRAGGKVVNGLVRRRAAERAIFLNGDYSRRP